MNGKKSKLLRQLTLMTLNNSESIESVYDTNQVIKVVDTGVLNEDGSSKLLQSVTNVRTLTKDCSRYAYKQAKKFYKVAA